MVEHAAPGQIFYGFPDAGDGVKVARHYQGDATAADQLDREVAPAEVERMRELVRDFLPDANGRLLQATVCMYTNTPDLDFVIDLLPDSPHVVVASPCSGHGFKFSSAIGEVLADLATSGRSAFDLAPFSLRRFQ